MQALKLLSRAVEAVDLVILPHILISVPLVIKVQTLLYIYIYIYIYISSFEIWLLYWKRDGFFPLSIPYSLPYFLALFITYAHQYSYGNAMSEETCMHLYTKTFVMRWKQWWWSWAARCRGISLLIWPSVAWWKWPPLHLRCVISRTVLRVNITGLIMMNVILYIYLSLLKATMAKRLRVEMHGHLGSAALQRKLAVHGCLCLFIACVGVSFFDWDSCCWNPWGQSVEERSLSHLPPFFILSFLSAQFSLYIYISASASVMSALYEKAGGELDATTRQDMDDALFRTLEGQTTPL